MSILNINVLYPGTTGCIVVCVSPLVSLMMDQRAKFSPKGLLVELVSQSQKDPIAKDNVLQEKARLVYISPES